MLVRFWGTRGSIPKPGSTTLRYGGNTSCVQITSREGHLLVIDCGSGAHNLGVHLLSQKKEPLKGSLLITHTHWDHIQGMPFFTPLFLPNWEWDIYGPQGLSQSIHDSLSGQMLHQYFPVSIEEFGAKLRYHDLTEGELEIGDMHITTRYLNHTNLTIGYRLESGGKVFVYSCDHEPFSKNLAYGEGEIIGQEIGHMEFLRDADLVVHDSQYTADEYEKKMGWGHSTVEYVIKICREANVKSVALSHHDPMRSDLQIDELNLKIQNQLFQNNSPMRVFFAYEGQEISLLEERGKALESPLKSMKEQKGEEQKNGALYAEKELALSGHSLLLYTENPKELKTLIAAAEEEGLAVDVVKDLESLKEIMKGKVHSLILLQHAPPQMDGIAIAKVIRKEGLLTGLNTPVIIITSEGIVEKESAIGISDWLITPFTSSIVRSKVSSWILRVSQMADEATSLTRGGGKREEGGSSLKELIELKRQTFDLLAKIVAKLFEVDGALIELDDGERRLFSRYLDAEVVGAPKDLSFCRGLLNESDSMRILGVSFDNTLIDNPLYYGNLPLRSLLAYPLHLDDGSRIGTLCLIDREPRAFDEKRVDLLDELRRVIVCEFF